MTELICLYVVKISKLKQKTNIWQGNFLVFGKFAAKMAANKLTKLDSHDKRR